jgi:hypothetical protein
MDRATKNLLDVIQGRWGAPDKVKYSPNGSLSVHFAAHVLTFSGREIQQNQAPLAVIRLIRVRMASWQSANKERRKMIRAA